VGSCGSCPGVGNTGLTIRGMVMGGGGGGAVLRIGGGGGGALGDTYGMGGIWGGYCCCFMGGGGPGGALLAVEGDCGGACGGPLDSKNCRAISYVFCIMEKASAAFGLLHLSGWIRRAIRLCRLLSSSVVVVFETPKRVARSP